MTVEESALCEREQRLQPHVETTGNEANSKSGYLLHVELKETVVHVTRDDLGDLDCALNTLITVRKEFGL